MPTLEVNEELIMALLAQLPPEQRERILSHVATARVQKSNQATDESPEKETGFGSGKNADAYMAPDFDEPLEDFKDYM
jgi:hypothetical protein